MSEQRLEEMSSFFNKRAGTYDNHMMKELDLQVFYNEIANCLPKGRNVIKVLDLGCGTGLELEGLFTVYPDAQVTGVDLSDRMLEVLKVKYKDKETQLNLVCKSYFDMDFGVEMYDLALSTYSLHHFSVEQKSVLYENVFKSLKQDGMYIEGDYTVKNIEEERYYTSENERIRKENEINEGFYHYDTPFAIQTQIELLRRAGFRKVVTHKEWDNTSIFVSCKEQQE